MEATGLPVSLGGMAAGDDDRARGASSPSSGWRGGRSMRLDLVSVFKQFDPDEPLYADDERYVDCLRERGIVDLFERLKLPLGDARPRSLFLSGVLGDGKTTILRRLQADLETEGDLVAFG
jgi:hypothetical protein